VTACVAFPNFNQGVYMTEELAAAVAPGGKLVVIGGPPVIDEAEQLAGVLHALEHTDLQLENDPTADRYRNLTDARPRAGEIMVDVLADFPEIDALMPYNDETMLGALPILEQSGRAGDMKVVARNGTPDGVAAVREGRVHGTWDIDCPGIGALMGDLVVHRLVDGAELDGDVALSPVGRMVTAATLHRWEPWDQRVPPVPLKVGLD
jgi:ABC-type sugar transport system substrate-binding protein